MTAGKEKNNMLCTALLSEDVTFDILEAKKANDLQSWKANSSWYLTFGSWYYLWNLKFRFYEVQSNYTAQQTNGFAKMSVLIWGNNTESQKADGFEFECLFLPTSPSNF